MTAAKTVAEALSLVMGEVQSISKDQAVTSGPARFNFRGVDDVMQAVGPALRKHGVVFAPSRVVSVEHERYETAKGSAMDGVTVVVEYTITGPAGDTMTAAAAGQAADSGDKAVPKAMSVAYRTVLLQALCIPTGDPDPDSNVHERVARPVRPSSGRDWIAEAKSTVSVSRLRELWSEAGSFGELTEGVKAAINSRVAEVGVLKNPDPWTSPAVDPDSHGYDPMGLDGGDK